MLKKIGCALILYSYDDLSFSEKIEIRIKILMTFAPIAFILDAFNFWYKDNKQFFSFIIVSLSLNMIVGAVFHLKNKTFNWREFWLKNIGMWVILIPVYTMLEFLRLTAGENIAGELFKTTIQLTTLLYPISKTLKNCYILSNKQFPPKFIMERIYKFEQNGNIEELISKKEEAPTE